MILLQTKLLDTPVQRWSIWEERVSSTLIFLESLCEHMVVAYNLPYDWFHVNKIYNLFAEIKNKDEWPRPREVAEIEQDLPCKWCLKPRDALDLLCYVKSGPLQSLMIPKKEVIKIKKIPIQIVNDLKLLLDSLIVREMPDIYFHYKTDKEWHIRDTNDPGFVNLVLSFAPSIGLKPVMRHLFPDEAAKDAFPDIPLPKLLQYQNEVEWAPWSKLSEPGHWLNLVPKLVRYWGRNAGEEAIKYATNDVLYLERLWNYFGKPSSSTNDILAASVGAARWRGATLDLPAIDARIKDHSRFLHDVNQEINPNAHEDCKRWILGNDVTPLQKIQLPNTAKETLHNFIEVNRDSTDIATQLRVSRAQTIVDARKVEKRLDILYKLGIATKFFPDFKVVGTKSNRMSGTGGLNAQGIPRDKSFRELFTFAERSEDSGDILSGGDFAGFEITIADAVYNDSNLRKDLRAGKSIHALLGRELFEASYEEIINDPERYNPSKNSVYSIIYGAMPFKLAQVAGIPEEQADRAYKSFVRRYPGVDRERRKVHEQFCSITQPNGIGSKVIWKDPARYVESYLGFRRWYTFENAILRELFDAAENLDSLLSSVDGKIKEQPITRSKGRQQTVVGATRSALFATAFQMQAQNMRSAANHVIQAAGAEICKELQRNLWELQPVGVYEWRIQLFNFHDEVLARHRPELQDQIEEIVGETLESYRDRIPLIGMTWKSNIKNWAELK